MLQTGEMPFHFNPKVSHDDVDVVGLRKRAPLDFVVGKILQRMLEPSPHAVIHLNDHA